jgi:hypothetical protein
VLKIAYSRALQGRPPTKSRMTLQPFVLSPSKDESGATGGPETKMVEKFVQLIMVRSFDKLMTHHERFFDLPGIKSQVRS